MSSKLIILLVFGSSFLFLCLIYAIYAPRRRRGGKQRRRSARTPRLYISQQVPSVFEAFKKRDR